VSPGLANAHDLPPDRLLLWPEPARGTIRGAITLDPEHTREEFADLPRAEIERRVLAFVQSELRLRVDESPLVLDTSLRRIWDPAEGTEGDLVDIRGFMPKASHELTVSVGKQIKAIVISVHTEQGGAGRNTLVKGGATSPPFRFGPGPLDAAWTRRSAEELLTEIDAPRSAARGAAPSASGNERAAGFARESRFTILKRYVALGFEHILPLGLDHLLFVAGLVLGSPREPRRLVLWLSAFTLAHTLTFALSALGVVGLPSSIVEPLIALSIAYVGVENLLRKGGDPKARLLLVFAFGLVHGLGFAGALRSLGLPDADRWLGLIGFNVGVEAGQLTAVAVLLPLLLLIDAKQVRRLAVIPGSALIAGAGLIWAVARLMP